jgi:purine-binding chemotaxis protein CheW
MRFRDRVRARVGSAELLVFRIGGEHFAVELKAVEEAIEAPPVRPIPEAPAPLLGVFTHRDRLLPLYSPSTILGVAVGEVAHVLVLRGAGRDVGVAVDDVDDVLRVELETLHDPPADDATDDLLLALLVRERELIGVVDGRALVTACQAAPLPTEL